LQSETRNLHGSIEIRVFSYLATQLRFVFFHIWQQEKELIYSWTADLFERCEDSESFDQVSHMARHDVL
jgi:hypothetical protein